MLLQLLICSSRPPFLPPSLLPLSPHSYPPGSRRLVGRLVCGLFTSGWSQTRSSGMSGGAAGALAVWLELHSRPLWLTHNSLRDFAGRYGSSSRDSIVCARARAARRERSRRDTRPCGMRAARDGGAETANPKRKAAGTEGAGLRLGPGPCPARSEQRLWPRAVVSTAAIRQQTEPPPPRTQNGDQGRQREIKAGRDIRRSRPAEIYETTWTLR